MANLKIDSFFSGGLGGQPGFYSFVHGISDAAHVPKSVANVGAGGQNGANAAPCVTNAADVFCNIHTKKHKWGLKRTRHWDFSFKQHVSDPRCPGNLQTSPDPVPPQLPRLPLNIPVGVNAYKAVLVENVNNFAFKNLIQKVQKAIEANPQLK